MPRLYRGRRVLAWAAAVLVAFAAGRYWSTLAGGTSTSGWPRRGDGRVGRVYDVRDLLVDVPDFVGAPSLGILKDAAATQTGAPPKTRAQIAAELMAVIRQASDPDAPAGGKTILEVGRGSFVVTADDAGHQRVEELLRAAREANSYQVTVACRFLTFDEKTRALIDGLPPPATTLPSGATVLDDEQADLLLRAVQSARSSTVVSAPRLTLFNGQRAYVLISSQQTFIAGYHIPTEPATQPLVPEIGIAQSGVVVDVRATVSADRRRVILSLRPELAHVGGFDTVPFDDAPPGTSLIVQRPNVRRSEVRLTTEIPDGRTALVRGLRDVQDPRHEMVLLVGVNIIRSMPVQPGPLTGTTPTTAPATAPTTAPN